MKKTTTLIASIFAAGLAFSAQAQLITFDDISGAISLISNGYQGLNWNNFGVFDPVGYGYTGTGYNHGTISPNNVAFNWGGNPSDLSSGSTFTLGSGYFTAAWADLNLEVKGYNGTALIYDQVYALNTTSPDFIVFNFSDITDAHFSTSTGNQFALDNLTLGDASAAVPEPAAYGALAGAGLLAVSLRSLFSRKQA